MSDGGSEIGSRVDAARPSGGGQRDVTVVGRRAPERTTSTRMIHGQRLFGARKYLLPGAIIGGGLFLLGATTGNPLIALAPLLAVLFVVGVLIWREATRLAAIDFYAGYAIERRFNYSQSMMLLASTPLLAAGDRRRCEHYLEGELAGVEGESVGVAHLVVETSEQKHDRRNRPISIFTPHEFTVAIVDLQRPTSTFPAVYLERRSRLFARSSWLDRTGLVAATLEDERLAVDCELLVDRSQDRQKLRSLLGGDLQRALAGSLLRPGFEYVNGTLLVYAAERLDRAEELDALVDLTGQITRRLLEVGEPLRVVEAINSQAPPVGVAAFPAPPPATKPRVEPTLRVAQSTPAPQPLPREDGRRSVPPPTG